eukprot:1226403-Pyramimonas_sp.AAC.1
MAPIWAKAAQHYDGEGLERGTDSYSYRRLLSRIQNIPRIRRRLAALLVSVATGATWPKVRKQAVLSSGNRQATAIDVKCDRCGED